MNSNGHIKPTTWKQKHVVTLPSGQQVKIRRLGYMDMLKAGRFPDELVSSVLGLINKVGKSGMLDFSTMKPDEVKNLMSMMETYFKASVIEPKIVESREEETDDTICFEDIEMDDVIWLFMNTGTSKARQAELVKDAQFFRTEPPAGDDAGRNVPEILDSPISSVVNPEPVEGA